jgi:PEP-CTERM motif
MNIARPDRCLPFRSIGAKVGRTIALAFTLGAGAGAGAAQAELVSSTLSFDSLGASTVGMHVPAGHGGFDWGSRWFSMSTAHAPDETFLATSTTGSTLITRSDHGDFFFDGADFWSRRGVDGTGDFYFMLYNDGHVVYDGMAEKDKRVFKGTASFMSVAAGTRIDALAFAFDNDDYDHLAMDNFRFRVDATATGSVTTVPEPHSTAMLLAGLGVIGVMGRRRLQHRTQSEKL